MGGAGAAITIRAPTTECTLPELAACATITTTTRDRAVSNRLGRGSTEDRADLEVTTTNRTATTTSRAEA